MKKIIIAAVLGLLWTLSLPFLFFYAFLAGIDGSSWLGMLISFTILLPMFLTLGLDVVGVPYAGEIGAFVVAEAIVFTAFFYHRQIYALLRNKKFWFAVGILVALYIAYFLFINRTVNGWKVFVNSKFNYSLQYPADLQPFTSEPLYSRYTVSFELPEGMGWPALYVAMLPEGADKSFSNYISPGEVDKLQKIKPGESYAMIEKLPDEIVGGENAIVVSNDVYTGSGDLKQLRAIFKKDKYTYVLGSYYATENQSAAFQRFIKSFKFCKFSFLVCLE